MIQRKFILDKRGIAINKLLILILVILTVAVTLILVFKVDINKYLRNLPGYSVPENDTLIENVGSDEKADSSCSEIGKIGASEGGKQYISFNGEKTNLYWDAGRRNEYVKVEKTKVAEVSGGVVSINPGFFNSNSEFDFDSDAYQEIRFFSGIDASYLVKIHQSYYGKNNFLCKNKDDAKIDYGWPENPIFLYTNSLNPRWVWEGGFRKLKVDFFPYLSLPENTFYKFLYVVDAKGHMEIRGARGAGDTRELGRIYPDGSIWLDRERLTNEYLSRPGIEISSEVRQKPRFFYKPYSESNLKVNYDGLRNGLFKSEEDEAEIDYWPEEPIVLGTSSLGLEIVEDRLKIDFSPYIILEDSDFEFLFIEDRDYYIEIKGYIPDGTDQGVGRIFIGGAIWFSRYNLISSGAKTSGEPIQIHEQSNPYYVSTLNVNYDELRNWDK